MDEGVEQYTNVDETPTGSGALTNEKSKLNRKNNDNSSISERRQTLGRRSKHKTTHSKSPRRKSARRTKSPKRKSPRRTKSPKRKSPRRTSHKKSRK